MCSLAAAHLKPLKSIAVVVPRYGASLGGGAETLARGLALALWQSRNRFGPQGERCALERLEIWTTCAIDHRTWANYHPPGMQIEDGIPVHRFPVDERNLELFIKHEIALADGWPRSTDDQLEWLENSVNSSALYQHIAERAGEFDLLLFAPYLFATTFWGGLICPERSVIIPCLHDEPYAYLPVFSHLFGQVRGVLFNANAEAQLAQELYGRVSFEDRSGVVGMGFEPLVERDKGDPPVGVREKLPVNYLLYSGRKERGKNLDLLLECFEFYREQVTDAPLELLLIGSGSVDFRERLPDGVTDLGFVSESDKRAIFSGATALCQPSVNESFSIVLMEGWQQGIPALVNGACRVTKEHVVQSGGGLYFTSPEEFVAVVERFRSDPVLCRRMGEAGRAYVETQYSWDAVLDRYWGVMNTIGFSAIEARV